MLQADRNLLKATLTRDLLDIQTKLIDLYNNNLQSIATQGALVSGFALTGIYEVDYPDTGYRGIAAQYIYFFFITIAFTLALYAVVLSTIISIRAPAASLIGDKYDIVLRVANQIREKREHILYLGMLSLTSLLLATIAWYWAKLVVGVASSTMAVYSVGMVIIYFESLRAWRIFHPPEEKTAGKERSKEDNDRHVAALNEAYERTQVRARGVIYIRESVAEGGELKQRYGVVEKGRFDYYESEDEYANHGNPINAKPVKLSKYYLELDTRKFSPEVTSIERSLRKKLFGNAEFGIAALATTDVDLNEAVRKYRFGLFPKVSSELKSLEALEMMAIDETSYKQWINTFTRIITAYDDLAALKESSESGPVVSKRRANVEMVVQAANVDKK